ncbi:MULTISPECIES: hypothetical protein [Edwardsiella]|uniref:hypothetical protein n=1 Tax=Edwardsiella TaxID=635 RepID=UPI00045C719C|nr:hypothetical protein [Edwardsiella anguillarum]GAJ68498.1 ST22 protein [Edwardsiella piscicida]
MNLFLKRNVESFLMAINENEVCNNNDVFFVVKSNLFDLFIESDADGGVFFTYSIGYRCDNLVKFLSELSPERINGFIIHVFIYRENLCICYQIDDLSSRYEKLLLMNHNKIKSIIERLCR